MAERAQAPGIAGMLGSLSSDALREALAATDPAVLGTALDGLGPDVVCATVHAATAGWDAGALLDAIEVLLARAADRPLDGTVPDAVLHRSIGRLHRLETRVGAERLRRISAMVERSSHTIEGARSPADLLTGLGLTFREAKDAVETAMALADMPETAAQVASGQLGLAQAGQAAKARAELDASLAEEGVDDEAAARRRAALDAKAAATPCDMDGRRMRRELDEHLERESADALAERERKAFRARQAFVWRDEKGQGQLKAQGPAEAMAKIGAMVEALARPVSAEDARTPEQRRFDALVVMAERYLAEGSLPEVAAQQPHVILTGTHDRLHGVDDAPPFRLDGFGTVSDEVAQMICCDAEVTLVQTDGAGQPLRIGRATRTPTRAQRRAVIGRDRGCVGCGAPAARCQVHHIRWWRRGGRTDVENLTLLCWACHTAVHQHGWEVIVDDGRYRAVPPERAERRRR
jgi:NAD-dependent dihydropyrimidine dehydrogenase PreA subunit